MSGAERNRIRKRWVYKLKLFVAHIGSYELGLVELIKTFLTSKQVRELRYDVKFCQHEGCNNGGHVYKDGTVYCHVHSTVEKRVWNLSYNDPRVCTFREGYGPRCRAHIPPRLWVHLNLYHREDLDYTHHRCYDHVCHQILPYKDDPEWDSCHLCNRHGCGCYECQSSWCECTDT